MLTTHLRARLSLMYTVGAWHMTIFYSHAEEEFCKALQFATESLFSAEIVTFEKLIEHPLAWHAY